MTRRTHFRPQLEQLGDRTLPSVAMMPHLGGWQVAHAAPAGHAAQARLLGAGAGSYTSEAVPTDTGRTYNLQGSAVLAGVAVGQFTVAGTLHSVGFIQNGRATGTLTFTSAKGSLTLQLEGPQQPGFSPLPHTFSYHIVSGTGAYANASGSGHVGLLLTQAAANDPSHGSFVLAVTP